MEATCEDQGLQELVRVTAATLRHYNCDSESHRGADELAILSHLFSRRGVKAGLSPAFVQFIDNMFEMAAQMHHYRFLMKSFYLWPETGYPPWEPVLSKIPPELAADLSECRFTIGIVNGKLFAHQTDDRPRATSLVWNWFRQSPHRDSEPVGLRGDGGKCHISLANSSVVNELGTTVIQEAIKEFMPSNEFQVEFDAINATVSKDWPRFRRCLVIAVNSSTINEFLDSFNTRFGTSLKPSPHVTFAVEPRSLVPDDTTNV